MLHGAISSIADARHLSRKPSKSPDTFLGDRSFTNQKPFFVHSVVAASVGTRLWQRIARFFCVEGDREC